MGIMDLFTLFGGLGLFLFGMKMMGDGLEKAAGTKLKKLLEYVTSNRLLAMLVGILVTAVIQSSSATTVMVVGFVNASLLNLSQAIGIIMGANIGTTVTSLMLSIKLNFGVIFASAGMVLIFFPKRESLKQIGTILMGLGILFIGMETMSNAMIPLREWQGFSDLMAGISHPLIGILVGALITAVLQSSSASVGILQALAGQGLIPFQTAIFILFGQNIGTCVTALLATAGTNHTAKRTALVHLIFNVLGTVIFTLIAVFLPFAKWIELLAPGNLRLQIALTHVIFNVVTTLILLPMASLLEKAAWLLDNKEDPTREPLRLQYFDKRMLNTPPIAAEQLFLEVKRMATLTVDNFHKAIKCFDEYDKELFQDVAANEDVIDYLNQEITNMLVEVKSAELPSKHSQMIGSLFHVVNDLERIADHSMNIADSAEYRYKAKISFSNKAQLGLEKLAQKVDDMLVKSVTVFKEQNNDPYVNAEIEDLEEMVDKMTLELRDMHMDRLKNKKCSVKSGMVFTDMLMNLERIADHSDNIASAVQD